MSARVLIAQIGAAHGVRGEVRLKAFTADPLAVARYGTLESEDGRRRFEIEAVRPGKDVLVARLKGVTSRNAAEALKNLRLYVARAQLPAPGDDEFYVADLIGLKAETSDGAAFGTVTAVHDFGAGDLIEIAPAGGGATVMLPFTATVVPLVDIAAGKLVIDPPGEAADEDAEGPPSLTLPRKGGGNAPA
ncbi:MAG TPA: ribosome maturation factor RimM [Xanthobacteraceae bacterium]|nr:ribosome maturation factor RimM [Xanthobacteraceae bacterium]